MLIEQVVMVLEHKVKDLRLIRFIVTSCQVVAQPM